MHVQRPHQLNMQGAQDEPSSPFAPIAYQLAVEVGGRSIIFEAEIRGGDEYDQNSRYLIIAPGKVGHRAALGCVVLTFSADPDDDVVVLQTLLHDPACTAAGQAPLMVLGALHAMRAIAHEAYPHLRRVELADESHFPPFRSFPCPPLSRAVKTFATDVLLHGSTYYQRHLGMAPTRGVVASALRAAAERMRRPIDVRDFATWWGRLAEGGLGQTAQQLEWLEAHEAEVRATFEAALSSGSSWGALFRELHERYDYAFFAACAPQLVAMFHLTPLLGAVWQVDMDALPDAVDGEPIHASITRVGDNADADADAHALAGGGGRSGGRGRLMQRLFTLSQRACYAQHGGG